ncbi:MAG TPA: L,D-transpeptidase, partial [Sorangium sp.]|nr:L,D-transpeptidase [Sorangium sp.]
MSSPSKSARSKSGRGAKGPDAKRGGTLTTVVGAVLGAAAGAALLGGLSWSGGCGQDTPPPGVSADERDTGHHVAATPVPSGAVPQRLPAPPVPPNDTNAPKAAEPEPPPPPEDDKPYQGPWLAALAQATPVYPTARFSKNRMGYIRRGAKVPVIDKPLKTNSCKQGFYPLVDGGYVCGKYATTNLDDARVKSGVTPPNIDALLPYRYAYNKAHGTPLYSVVPSREDMLRYEPYLDTKRIAAEKKKAQQRQQAERAAAKAEAAAK